MRKKIALVVLLFSIIFGANAIAEPASPLVQLILDNMANIKSYYLNLTDTKVNELDSKYETNVDNYVTQKRDDVKLQLNSYVNQQISSLDGEMNTYIKEKEDEINKIISDEVTSAKQDIDSQIENAKKDKKAEIDKMFEDKIKVKFQVN